MKETKGKTTLGKMRLGSRVNLERAVSSSGRFNGHFVTGHIDGQGKVVSVKDAGGSREIRVETADDIFRYLVNKGSVAIDGVSLTVSETADNSFSVFLIPLTLGATNLGERREGDEVNIETDIIGKYIAKFAMPHLIGKTAVTEGFLKKYGYV